MTRKPPEQRKSEQIPLRLTPPQAAQLDKLMKAGGFSSRSEVAASIVLAVLGDDAREHGEPVA